MKKATGIVRKIDDLGRVVIPRELRRTMAIREGDALEIFVDSEGEIILKKYLPGCAFCNNVEHLWGHRGKWICQTCVDALAERDIPSVKT